MKIQFRSWNAPGFAADPKTVGEPFIDPVLNRFGFYNDHSYGVDWYPTLDSIGMFLNQGQLLGGRDSINAKSNMHLDWSTPGELRIINLTNNTVIARFSAAGAEFSASASIANGVNGIVNKLANSSLTVRRSALAATIGTFEGTGPFEPFLIAPNWMAYKQNNTAGKLTFSISDILSPNPSVRSSVEIRSSNAPTSGGLRHFIKNASAFRGKTITFAAYVIGTRGSRFRTRLIDSTSAIVVTSNWVATGAWDRVSMTITLPPTYQGEWIAFDSIYSPGYSSLIPTSWAVAGPTMNIGASPASIDENNAGLDFLMCQSLYSENSVLLTQTYPKAIVPVKIPNSAGLLKYEAFTSNPLFTPFVTNLTPERAYISVISPSSEIEATLHTYFAPIVI